MARRRGDEVHAHPEEDKERQLFPAMEKGCLFSWQVAPKGKNPQAIITAGTRNIHISMVNWNYTGKGCRLPFVQNDGNTFPHFVPAAAEQPNILGVRCWI